MAKTRQPCLQSPKRHTMKKTGRPKSWTSPLLKKMIMLHLYSEMTNSEILRSLRDTKEGTRSMQDYRKQLLCRTEFQWRPRDAKHMQKRLKRLQSCLPFSSRHHAFPLDQYVAARKQAELSTTVQEFTKELNVSTIKRSTITFEQIRTAYNCTRIRVTFKHRTAGQQAFTCEWPDTSARVEEMFNTEPWLDERALAESSLVMSSIDFLKYPIFDHKASLVTIAAHTSRLALNHCSLRSVPSWVLQFHALQYLNLRRNWLREISTVRFSPELIILDLSHNEIENLPDSLYSLRKLRLLDVSQNRIKRLPSWLGEMLALESLMLSGNPLDIDQYELVDFAYHRSDLRCPHNESSHCLTASTQLLKRSLLHNNSSGNYYIYNSQLTCSCKIASSPSIQEHDEDDHEDDGPPKTLKSQQEDEPLDVLKILRNTLVLTGSARSSLTIQSVATLESFSSAGRGTRSSDYGTSWRKLLLVHCCMRQGMKKHTPCIHQSVMAWAKTGISSMPSLEVLRGRDFGDNNALHIAAIWGLPSTVLFSLLNLGCDPGHLNRDGQTFLHVLPDGYWHMQGPSTSLVINELVNQQFPFCHRDHRGTTIFHKAEIMEQGLNFFFAESAWLCRSMRNAMGELPHGLHHIIKKDRTTGQGTWFACHRNGTHSESLMLPLFSKYLSNDPSSVHAAGHVCCEQQSSPLHQFASALYHDFRTFIHRSPFPQAISCIEVLRELLQEPTDIDAYNERGHTVLMAFIRGIGHQWPRHKIPAAEEIEACVVLLLDHGADIHRRDRKGNTALHFAANYCLPAIVKQLVEHGADVNARNDRGISAVQLVFEKQRDFRSVTRIFTHFQQCIVILLDHEADIDAPPVHRQPRQQGQLTPETSDTDETPTTATKGTPLTIDSSRSYRQSFSPESGGLSSPTRRLKDLVRSVSLRTGRRSPTDGMILSVTVPT